MESEFYSERITYEIRIKFRSLIPLCGLWYIALWHLCCLFMCLDCYWWNNNTRFLFLSHFPSYFLSRFYSVYQSLQIRSRKAVFLSFYLRAMILNSVHHKLIDVFYVFLIKMCCFFVLTCGWPSDYCSSLLYRRHVIRSSL